MKPTLYLHIGHPKTGSSAFQVFLARAAVQLATEGILYPRLSSWEAATRGHVNSGNIPLGPASENWLRARVMPVLLENQMAYRAFLFSNENLLHRMHEFFDAVSDLQPHCYPHVLWAVRNPLDQLSSVYQQLVKRHGYTANYEQFLADCNYRCNALNKSAKIVAELDAAGICYSLLNYSVFGRDIVRELARCINISEDLFRLCDPCLPCISPVNRSLSAVELQLVLLINSIYGRDTGRKLADALVNQLPDVKSVSLPIDPLVSQRVEAVNQFALQSLNARLPTAVPLTFAGSIGDALTLHCNLSPAQLVLCRDVLSPATPDVIATSLAGQKALSDRVLHLLGRATQTSWGVTSAGR